MFLSYIQLCLVILNYNYRCLMAQKCNTFRLCSVDIYRNFECWCPYATDCPSIFEQLFWNILVSHWCLVQAHRLSWTENYEIYQTWTVPQDRSWKTVDADVAPIRIFLFSCSLSWGTMLLCVRLLTNSLLCCVSTQAEKAEKEARDLMGTMRKRMEFLDFD
jgi:hypothetical protein